MKKYLYIPIILVLLACQTYDSNHYSMVMQQSEYILQTGIADDIPQQTQQIKEYLQATMVENIDLIWSNYSWQGLQVLFVYPSKASSYLWPIGKQMVKVQTKELPEQAQGLYSNLYINGRQTMAVDLENDYIRSVSIGARLVAHEFFHFTAQRDWNFRNQRATLYPKQAGPRLYRKMIYKALAAYWQSFGTESQSQAKQQLGYARYWYDRWLNEYPNELKQSQDIVEGTANYVDIMAGAMGSLKAKTRAINEENLQKSLQNLQHLFTPYMESESVSLDQEAYGLGALAVTMLRFGVVGPELSLEGWNDLIAKGQEPLAILLENVAPIQQEPDAVSQEQLERIIEEENEILAPTYDVLVAQWLDSANYVRVRLPIEFLYAQGNLYAIDFGYLSNIGQTAIQLAQAHSVVSTTGGKTRLSLDNGFIEQQPFLIVMLPRSLFKETDQSQTLTLPEADNDSFIGGKLQGKLQQEGDITYFVAE